MTKGSRGIKADADHEVKLPEDICQNSRLGCVFHNTVMYGAKQVNSQVLLKYSEELQTCNPVCWTAFVESFLQF